MAVSKAQQKAVAKYMKNNYDNYQIRMPKGKKDIIKQHAEQHGESLNGFINRAIDETMERDDNEKSAVRAARQEYANGETVNHDAINWD